MNKETENTVVPKTFWEKCKESFHIALMSAGIILVLFLLIWIPFKVIPSIFSNGSNYVATTLSSLIVPGEATSTTPVATNNKPVTNSNGTTNSAPAYSAPTYYGKPDLEISLIGTGIIDPASKQFMQTSYSGFNDEIAIKFQVKNVGTNVTGLWKLRINTPSRTTPYFDSDYQQSIKPGDRIVFTTTFDSPINTGINTAYITIDPLNMIDEISKTNNQLIVPLNIQGTYYSYNNYGTYNSSVLPYGTLYSWTNITANCYANPQTGYQGSPITWLVSASGGNGYFSYSWTGSDQLYSTDNIVTKNYYSSGQKIASVTVTSNGVSVTKQCSAYIY